MLYVNPIATSYASQAGAASGDAARERMAVEELEHFFVFTLLQEMRKTIPEDGLLGGGFESELFNQMLDDALSEKIAQSGQLGIADMVQEQLHIAEVQRQLATSRLELTSSPT
ncbi:MAG: rod-binding protein [Candidatus Hydrogenedentes bacterium]|nr:rod-binding protein [Candidatus Hydrogenedentota bacterium]